MLGFVWKILVDVFADSCLEPLINEQARRNPAVSDEPEWEILFQGEPFDDRGREARVFGDFWHSMQTVALSLGRLRSECPRSLQAIHGHHPLTCFQ